MPVKTKNKRKNDLVILSNLCKEDYFESIYFNRQIAYRYKCRFIETSKDDYIETAAYKHYINDIPTTLAIDISTMVGCPLLCKFCESGLLSYVRPLESEEMFAQAKLMINKHDKPLFPKITCSFQGIGEPSFLPFRIIDVGLRLLSYNRRIAISISTTGANLYALKYWRKSGMYIDNLQFSLSGTNEKQLNWLMPRLPKIDSIIDEARLCSESNNINKVKFNYVLIKDFNDSDDDADCLINFFKDSMITIRLARLNHTKIASRYSLFPSTKSRAIAFLKRLTASGIRSYLYGSLEPTNVSCGQLAFVDKKVK